MNKGIAIIAVLFLLVTGCSYFRGSTGTGPSDQGSRSRIESPNAVFHTFPDIPIPKELKLVTDRSFIYETPGMKVGVLLLSGNVDVSSLENYFKVSMVKNGWRFVNSYKYGDTILNFVKEERASNIRIGREAFTTQVEIWVGPTEKGGSPSVQKSDGIR